MHGGFSKRPERKGMGASLTIGLLALWTIAFFGWEALPAASGAAPNGLVEQDRAGRDARTRSCLLSMQPDAEGL
jgi:hypothetical protein